MRRHKNLIPFSHDHHHGLRAAALLKKNAPIYQNLPNDLEGKRHYFLIFYETDLLKHFKEEEEILYPRSYGKDKELDALWNEILDDHAKIKQMAESINEPSEDIEEKLNLLGEMLEEHIRKEERILFPKIQYVLNEDELDHLV